MFSCQYKHLPITGLPLLVCPSSSSSSLSSILFESKSILFELLEELGLDFSYGGSLEEVESISFSCCILVFELLVIEWALVGDFVSKRLVEEVHGFLRY